MPKEDKVVVDGVNVHARTASRPGEPQGGIDRASAPLHVSKVAIYGDDGKPTASALKSADGKKVRVAVKSGRSCNGRQMCPAEVAI